MDHFAWDSGWVACGDCLEGEDTLGPVDLVFADPPFGIRESFFDGMSNMYHRKKGNVAAGYEEIEPENYQVFTNAWVYKACNWLRPGGTLWAVSGWTHSHIVHASILSAGLILVNKLIWNYNFGVYTKRKFVSAHFEMFYAVKPPLKAATFNRLITDTKMDYHDRQSVWHINREYAPGERKNATKLPTCLVEKVIQHTTNPGNLVMDPFMGNGTTAIACIKTGRLAIGFEKNPLAYQDMIPRIQEVCDAGQA